MRYMTLQVMNLFMTDPLPCRPIATTYLRHLILWTRDLPAMVGRLNDLTSLETLSLRAETSGSCLDVIPTIDVTRMTNLKHLRCMDFAVAHLKMPEGCQLHFYLDNSYKGDVVYPLGPGSRPIPVLRCPMWNMFSKRLGSLCLTLCNPLDPERVQELQAIVRSACQLDFVRLEVQDLGSKKNPFDISEVFAGTRRVVIVVEYNCRLKCSPSSRSSCQHLSIRCEGKLSMQLQKLPAFLHGLCSFSIQYRRLRGVSPVDLVSALEGDGRHVVKQDMLGKRTRWVHTQDSCKRIQAFDRLMFCGCHTCPECLFMDGKFMKDKSIRYTSARI